MPTHFDVEHENVELFHQQLLEKKKGEEEEKIIRALAELSGADMK